jgi:hypothetical protein
MDNFDLKKYLVENKVTTNSKMLTENQIPAVEDILKNSTLGIKHLLKIQAYDTKFKLKDDSLAAKKNPQLKGKEIEIVSYDPREDFLAVDSGNESLNVYPKEVEIIQNTYTDNKEDYFKKNQKLNENQSEKFDEIYKAFQQDPVLKNWIYPEGERERLNISTFMIPGKVFEENFLDIISQKTGLQKDDVRKKLLDNPLVGTKRPTKNSEYDFVDRSPTIYTNGNYLNAYEVLKNALKEL